MKLHGARILAPLLLSCFVLATSGPGAVMALEAPADKSESAEALTKTFGVKLAEAARQQIATLVIYDPTYRKLDYPMGDVPWYLGVCTDVIVRAYRQLGIDLQPLVHQSRVGSGDRNIDHRRVTVLRNFFRRKGQALPVSKDPVDFLPGDIVSYYVPDGTFSKTHIAIVSDRKTWSGVPMIIHNRGYSVQEEDALFAEEMTGHYRYSRSPNIDGWNN